MTQLILNDVTCEYIAVNEFPNKLESGFSKLHEHFSTDIEIKWPRNNLINASFTENSKETSLTVYKTYPNLDTAVIIFLCKIATSCTAE